MFKKYLFTTIIIFLLLSLSGNVYLFWKIKKSQLTESPSPQNFSLLNPSVVAMSIDSNTQSVNQILHYRELRPLIEKMISSFEDGERVGVYTQNINTGAWLGINERTNFVPASLLKIPIAMAVLKNIEERSLSFVDKVEIIKEDIDSSAGVSSRFKEGEEETILELLKIMLKISDNTAKNALKRLLMPEDINSVFSHVGIDNPYLKKDENQLVTPRQFSRLFKALYFSSYLSHEHSEMLLELMTETRQESLIAAGVPWEIQVAHKYGERFDLLHDCGIVYVPLDPYFLCVMTSQIEVPTAQLLIQDISAAVYKFVSAKGK